MDRGMMERWYRFHRIIVGPLISSVKRVRQLFIPTQVREG